MAVGLNFDAHKRSSLLRAVLGVSACLLLLALLARWPSSNARAGIRARGRLPQLLTRATPQRQQPATALQYQRGQQTGSATCDQLVADSGVPLGGAWAGTTVHARHGLYPRFMQCVLHGRGLAVPSEGEYVAQPCEHLTGWHNPWRKVLMNATTAQVAFDECRPLLTDRIKLPEQHSLAQWARRRTVNLRASTSDWRVFKQVFCMKQWDLLMQILPYVPFDRPVSVLDAGANIGFASIFLVPLIRNLGTVTAVEASPPTFKQLALNVKEDAIVTPVHSALVPEPEAGSTVTFGNDDKGAFWGARVQTGDQPAESANSTNSTEPNPDVFKVKTVSMRQLAERTPEKRFDFIKLDIEGYERRLFDDPSSIDTFCRATCIIAELHDFLEIPGLSGIRDAWDRMMARGCGDEGEFEELHRSGEHIVACKVVPRL